MRGKRVIELKDGSGKREVQREQQEGRVRLPVTRKGDEGNAESGMSLGSHPHPPAPVGG